MTVQRLRALVGDDFDAVNRLIIEKTQSQIILVDDLANHIIQSGGKRLRPLIALLACHACHYQGQHHVNLAALIEFFHTATLLHDDVIDESTLRRGRKTANTIWGSKASILVGDYLFSEYMQLVVNVGNIRIMQLLTSMAHQTVSGEIKQMSLRNNPLLTMVEYFDVIHSKTSLLFASSACVGALISHAPKEVEEGLYNYGLHLGNAFQLVDDALDYCSDSMTIGKNIGDDLADGKATMPLLHILKHGTLAQQKKTRESLEQGTLQYLPEILEAIEATKAIDYTYEVAAKEVDSAITSLQVLPDTIYKEALIDLAYYAVQRDH